MQQLPPMQCGGKYAIRGKEVTAVRVLSYGPKADFAKIVTLEAKDGACYKLTQWDDGVIYRVTEQV